MGKECGESRKYNIFKSPERVRAGCTAAVSLIWMDIGGVCCIWIWARCRRSKGGITVSKFGLYGKFTTVEGQRDTLVELLLEASKSMEELNDCELYVVSVADDEPDSVYVYEVWNNESAHQASLSLEAAQALIQRAKPIIKGMERINTLSPVGGKGI